MLPATHRLTAPADFREVVRRGRRQGRPTLVVHARVGDGAPGVDAVPVTAGFVVSKAVGTAVVRSRVKRRLRHLVADRLGALPPGTRLVVRALPSAAGADAADLARDLDRALERLVPVAVSALVSEPA